MPAPRGEIAVAQAAVARSKKPKAKGRAGATTAQDRAAAEEFERLHPRAAKGRVGGGAWIKKGQGMEGDPDRRVRQMQNRLAALGYAVDGDGRFGPKTEAALKEFQRDNGVEVSGVADEATVAAMRQAQPKGAGTGGSGAYGDKYRGEAGREARGDQNAELTGNRSVNEEPAAAEKRAEKREAGTGGSGGSGGREADGGDGGGEEARTGASGGSSRSASSGGSRSGGSRAGGDVLYKGVGMGQRSDKRVRDVQALLDDLGYDLGETGVDGRFGPATERALKLFQRRLGLKPDGILGKQTRSALNRQASRRRAVERVSPGSSLEEAIGGNFVDVIDPTDLLEAPARRGGNRRAILRLPDGQFAPRGRGTVLVPGERVRLSSQPNLRLKVVSNPKGEKPLRVKVEGPDPYEIDLPDAQVEQQLEPDERPDAGPEKPRPPRIKSRAEREALEREDAQDAARRRRIAAAGDLKKGDKVRLVGLRGDERGRAEVVGPYAAGDKGDLLVRLSSGKTVSVNPSQVERDEDTPVRTGDSGRTGDPGSGRGRRDSSEDISWFEGGADAGFPGRSNAGRLRNFRSMSDEKLERTQREVRRGNADRTAEAAIEAEQRRRREGGPREMPRAAGRGESAPEPARAALPAAPTEGMRRAGGGDFLALDRFNDSLKSALRSAGVSRDEKARAVAQGPQEDIYMTEGGRAFAYDRMAGRAREVAVPNLGAMAAPTQQREDARIARAETAEPRRGSARNQRAQASATARARAEDARQIRNRQAAARPAAAPATARNFTTPEGARELMQGIQADLEAVGLKPHTARDRSSRESPLTPWNHGGETGNSIHDGVLKVQGNQTVRDATQGKIRLEIQGRASGIEMRRHTIVTDHETGETDTQLKPIGAKEKIEPKLRRVLEGRGLRVREIRFNEYPGWDDAVSVEVHVDKPGAAPAAPARREAAIARGRSAPQQSYRVTGTLENRAEDVGRINEMIRDGGVGTKVRLDSGVTLTRTSATGMRAIALHDAAGRHVESYPSGAPMVAAANAIALHHRNPGTPRPAASTPGRAGKLRLGTAQQGDRFRNAAGTWEVFSVNRNTGSVHARKVKSDGTVSQDPSDKQKFGAANEFDRVDNAPAGGAAPAATDRDAAARAAHPEGSTVTTTVASIGGRSERVTGRVVGHSRGQLVVETPSHGRIVVPLNKVEASIDAPLPRPAGRPRGSAGAETIAGVVGGGPIQRGARVQINGERFTVTGKHTPTRWRLRRESDGKQVTMANDKLVAAVGREPQGVNDPTASQQQGPLAGVPDAARRRAREMRDAGEGNDTIEDTLQREFGLSDAQALEVVREGIGNDRARQAQAIANRDRARAAESQRILAEPTAPTRPMTDDDMASWTEGSTILAGGTSATRRGNQVFVTEPDGRSWSMPVSDPDLLTNLNERIIAANDPLAALRAAGDALADGHSMERAAAWRAARARAEAAGVGDPALYAAGDELATQGHSMAGAERWRLAQDAGDRAERRARAVPLGAAPETSGSAPGGLPDRYVPAQGERVMLVDHRFKTRDTTLPFEGVAVARDGDGIWVRGDDGEEREINSTKLRPVAPAPAPAATPRAAAGGRQRATKVTEGRLTRPGSDSYQIKSVYKVTGPNGEDQGVIRQEKEFEREMSGSIQVGMRPFGTFWYWYPNEREAEKGTRSSLRKQRYSKAEALAAATEGTPPAPAPAPAPAPRPTPAQMRALVDAGNALANGHSMERERRWREARAAAPGAPAGLLAAGDELASGHSMAGEQGWRRARVEASGGAPATAPAPAAARPVNPLRDVPMAQRESGGFRVGSQVTSALADPEGRQAGGRGRVTSIDGEGRLTVQWEDNTISSHGPNDLGRPAAPAGAAEPARGVTFTAGGRTLTITGKHTPTRWRLRDENGRQVTMADDKVRAALRNGAPVGGAAARRPERETEQIEARFLRVDDIVIDEDGEHEVTNIDIDPRYSTMGVTMHGEEAGGEFVYRQDARLTVVKRSDSGARGRPTIGEAREVSPREPGLYTTATPEQLANPRIRAALRAAQRSRRGQYDQSDLESQLGPNGETLDALLRGAPLEIVQDASTPTGGYVTVRVPGYRTTDGETAPVMYDVALGGNAAPVRETTTPGRGQIPSGIRQQEWERLLADEGGAAVAPAPVGGNEADPQAQWDAQMARLRADFPGFDALDTAERDELMAQYGIGQDPSIRASNERKRAVAATDREARVARAQARAAEVTTRLRQTGNGTTAAELQQFAEAFEGIAEGDADEALLGRMYDGNLSGISPLTWQRIAAELARRQPTPGNEDAYAAALARARSFGPATAPAPAPAGRAAEQQGVTDALRAELERRGGGATPPVTPPPAGPTPPPAGGATPRPNATTRTARAPSGGLRNFRSMGVTKLRDTYDRVAWEGNDPEALAALKAEGRRRGMVLAGVPQREPAAVPSRAAERGPTAPRPAGQTGRSGSGRLRNFGAMSDAKLQQAATAILRELNDQEAIAAVDAELIRRGLPRPTQGG